MTILLRQARIIKPGSPLNGQVKDILVSNGLISDIKDTLPVSADLVIEQQGLCVSDGWVDLFANFCDPGFEHRETLASGAAAAAAGGFTDVLLVPNTSPAITGKSTVEYICQSASHLPVNLHPIGAVSKLCEGKELAEMYDMAASGAVAFSDGVSPIQSAGLMTKALLYVKPLSTPLIQVPEDRSMAAGGLINEGIVSTRLGLPGKPALAEELMVARDIELLQYTGSKLHLTGISTRKAVSMIRKAKDEGLNISASVTAYHLFFTDEDLAGYDSNLKVSPPLRTSDDRQALLEGINDGTIDAIASHHEPLHWDDKTCEFEYAKNGMSNLETVYGAVQSVIPDTRRIIQMLTTGPRKILSLPEPSIAEGQPACLTVFVPGSTYTADKQILKGKSANNAFVGRELTGKVLGIIHKNQHNILI